MKMKNEKSELVIQYLKKFVNQASIWHDYDWPQSSDFARDRLQEYKDEWPERTWRIIQRITVVEETVTD